LGAAGVGFDLNFDIGGEQGELIAIFLDQDIRQYRQGVPLLDNPANGLQWSEKVVP